MKSPGAGKIMDILSVCGIVAPSKGLQVAYAVARHAAIWLTRASAIELAPLGMQVKALVPAAISPRWRRTYVITRVRTVGRATPAGRPRGRWAGSRGDPRSSCIRCLGLRQHGSQVHTVPIRLARTGREMEI